MMGKKVLLNFERNQNSKNHKSICKLRPLISEEEGLKCYPFVSILKVDVVNILVDLHSYKFILNKTL